MSVHNTDGDNHNWGVLVNETGIFATRGGSDWWMQYWANYSTRPNWTTFEAGAMGSWHHIAFPTKDDAEFARNHMIGQGIAATFLKVTTFDSARKSVERRGDTHRRLADKPGTGNMGMDGGDRDER